MPFLEPAPWRLAGLGLRRWPCHVGTPGGNEENGDIQQKVPILGVPMFGGGRQFPMIFT